MNEPSVDAQDVIESLSRQIAELTVRLAVREAHLRTLMRPDPGEVPSDAE
jgi:uncharacterized coiled-coil protein SlyX